MKTAREENLDTGEMGLPSAGKGGKETRSIDRGSVQNATLHNKKSGRFVIVFITCKGFLFKAFAAFNVYCVGREVETLVDILTRDLSLQERLETET